MWRHSTHVDRHSTTSSRHSIAWDNARSMGRGLNGWRLTECLLIEMYHDVSYDPWYLWICTTHIQPPHVQYVAWKWCVHTTYTHILICSRYFSRCQSEIIQHRTCHLEAVWACMDNLILWFFSHWNSLPSWTELAQERSNRLILCWGYFTWKQYLGNTFLTCLYPWEAPFHMCYLFWSGGSNLKVSFNFECHKGMPKWCETSVFPQVSTQSMNYERYHES